MPRWPEEWQAGESLARLKLLGVIPLGSQWLQTSFPALERGYCVRDDGRGDLAKKMGSLDH